MPSNKPRFTIVIDDDLFKQVDDYRYRHRLTSQSKAICDLVERGLNVVLEEEATKKAAESEKSDSTAHYEDPLANTEAIQRNPVAALTEVLCRAGLVGDNGDISDADLAFLEAAFLLFKAHFNRPEEGGK